MPRPIVNSLEAILKLQLSLWARFAEQKREYNRLYRELGLASLGYGSDGVPRMVASSAESKSPRGFFLKTHEPCSSCLARDALDILGIPRREPKSGMRMSYGCEECAGAGMIPVTSKREKPKFIPGSEWSRMGDPYSRDVSFAVSRAKGRR